MVLLDNISEEVIAEEEILEIVIEDGVVLAPTAVRTNDAIKEANEESTQLREKF